MMLIVFDLSILTFICVLMSVCQVNRGSYISAQVLLIFLLDKLGKRDIMRGLRSILSLLQQV